MATNGAAGGPSTPATGSSLAAGGGGSGGAAGAVSYPPPSATSSELPAFELPPNVRLHPPTAQIRALMTIIRSAETSRADWIFSADRVIRLIVEFALNFLPVSPVTVTTPVDGAVHEGVAFSGKILGVSVVRAGEAMEPALRSCCRSCRIGKILIQRDEATAAPTLFFAKLPEDVASRHVLLLDPMLATGGSARMAIQALLDAGVPQSKIVFVSVLAAREGLAAVCAAYPDVSVVTAAVDAGLNAKKFIVPGVGDFGTWSLPHFLRCAWAATGAEGGVWLAMARAFLVWLACLLARLLQKDPNGTLFFVCRTWSCLGSLVCCGFMFSFLPHRRPLLWDRLRRDGGAKAGEHGRCACSMRSRTRTC